jgi:RHS repeat-associated protein
MPNSPHETLLCRYHYDPLDRQSGCTLPQQPVIQRFHCDGRLTTEIQGGTRWSILQHDDHLLAQRNHREASVTATLLATDQQRSVLNTLDATGPHPLAYSPYGHHPAIDRLLSVRGFNGEQPDPLTGHYHLGNGYRQFNPVLMRFTSPDSWSPFGEGGLNAYGYCEGEPVNRLDPTGHFFLTRFVKGAKNLIGVRIPSKLHIKNINNILNGTELTYDGEVLLKSISSEKLQPVDLKKISTNKIIEYTNAINNDTTPIYKTVKQYRDTADPAIRDQIYELTSHHKVLTHTQIMGAPKHKIAIDLGRSVTLNRGVKEAKKLLPKLMTDVRR